MTADAAILSPARASIRRRRRRWRAVALLLAGCVGLGACSLAKKTRRMFGGSVVFEVAVDPVLNENFPLAVDLVVVYDRDLLKELEKLDAATWFEKEREQYLRSFEDRLELHSWEWVPDRPVPTQTVSHRRGARAGVVFAHYFADGDHRATVKPFKHFYLELRDTAFDVDSLEGSRARSKIEKIKKKQDRKARKQERRRQKKGGGSSPE